MFLTKLVGECGSGSCCDITATAPLDRLAHLWAKLIWAGPWGLPPWSSLQAGVCPKTQLNT